MPADSRIYDSPRLARCYASTRPPVHAEICRRAFAGREPGLRFRSALDVGCGAGTSTAALLPYASTLTGIDPYEVMLREARRRIPEATFLQGRADQLPMRDASVDLVSAAGSINYSDPRAALAEISRVLERGGTVFVYDFSTGRVQDERERSASAFDSFERLFPWPAGYALGIDELPYAECGLRLDHHAEFAVDLPMTEHEYIEYLLGETNVEAAVSGGMPEAEARNVCQGNFGPCFDGKGRHVRFASVFAMATRV